MCGGRGELDRPALRASVDAPRSSGHGIRSKPTTTRVLCEGCLETEESLAQLDTFDAVVEATGAQEALRAVLHDSAASATILLLGMSYGASTFDFEQVVGYDKTIVGSVGSGHDDFEQAIELLQHIGTSTLIEKVLPMSEYQQAWQMARSGEALKVVLRVDSSLDARVLSGDWARKAWR